MCLIFTIINIFVGGKVDGVGCIRVFKNDKKNNTKLRKSGNVYGKPVIDKIDFIN